MGLSIEKIIICNRAPFERLELDLNENCIALLNAFNGGGKTTIISHLADSFYEMARPYFPNEFANREDKLYRVSSSLFNLEQSKPSFFYVRFKYVEERQKVLTTIDYADIRGNCTKEEYESAIKLSNRIPFNLLSGELKERGFVKKLSSSFDKKRAKRIFDTNVLTYFPAYRFEYPGYLNTCYKDSIKFEKEASFSGFLPNSLEIVTNFTDLMNWAMDVLLDWQVYKTTKDISLGEGEKLQIDVTPEKIQIWDALNEIIDKAIINKDGGRLRLGIGKRTNPGQRISIMRDESVGDSRTKYPSIFNISSGEMSIISMFGEILRQADAIGFRDDTAGIVLIDEIDKHLHIKLQKEALPFLFEIFPNVQFIVSSHSPFVAMGLTERASKRFSSFSLGDKTGFESQLMNNPLYDEVYKMLIDENENYKNRYEKLLETKTNQNLLLVEDKYDQLYKIAWLKLMNIDFDAESFERLFQKNAPFEIVNNNSASGVAGCLNVNNPALFSKRKLIGLFDFDEEGSKRFCMLREGFEKNNILGDLQSGFYRKKNTEDCVKMYALLLPVPQRLSFLISRSQNKSIWEGNGNFSNYVEIETLLSEDFLKKSANFEKDNICGNDYYVAKDNKKNVLWKELIDKPKEVFADYAPLFSRIYELFELEAFKGE